ncbi:MAG: LysM domain-containing protein [Candidatus Gastranaerophilaceae bacterium]|jgi:nucleoid-associated protein YgaU
MKSSSLHRSNLTRERLAVLEELLSDKQKNCEAATEQYNKQNKDREIDILWQGLKSHKDERSPGIYLSIGFVTGAICMFLMSSTLNFGQKTENTTDLSLWKKGNIVAKQTPVHISLSGSASTSNPQSPNVKQQSYVVKSGDTLEKIAINVYGATDPQKVKDIQTVNNIKNPNSIQIGQTLTVPVNE